MAAISSDPPLFTAAGTWPAAEKASYTLALQILEKSASRDALAPLTKEVQASGRTLLHIAAERGPTLLVEELLKAGADSSPEDMAGITPLHLAAMTNHEATDILLLAGARADATNKWLRTPLHLAALVGAQKSASTLLTRVKGIIDHLDIFGYTARGLALALGHKETAALFPEDFPTTLFTAKKMLSQISGYSGSFHIASSTKAEEGFFPYPFSAKYAEILEEEHPLKQAMFKAASAQRRAKDIVSEIEARELVILHCIVAADAHCFSVVIWHDFLMVCNRGLRPKEMPSIKCYGIDHRKIEEAHIAPLLDSRLMSDWKLYIYQQLPLLLAPKEPLKDEADLCALFESLSPKEQKVGNCSAASVKTAGRAALMLFYYNKDPKSFANHTLRQVLVESKQHSFRIRKLLEEECLAIFSGKPVDADTKGLVKIAKIKRLALENKHLSHYVPTSFALPSPLLVSPFSLLPEGFR